MLVSVVPSGVIGPGNRVHLYGVRPHGHFMASGCYGKYVFHCWNSFVLGCGAARPHRLKKNRRLCWRACGVGSSLFFRPGKLIHCHPLRPGHARYTGMPCAYKYAHVGALNRGIQTCRWIHLIRFLSVPLPLTLPERTPNYKQFVRLQPVSSVLIPEYAHFLIGKSLRLCARIGRT